MGQDEIGTAIRDQERPRGDSTASYSLLHATRIGRYNILRVLGEGGFGQVLLAHDQDLGRTVAIKVPNPNRTSRAETVEAFLAEARILAALDHPHIVPVYDVGRTEDGQVFVVSKLIEGSDLRAVLAKTRPSFQETAALVAAVAEALHYAHTHGLVHRDIKPGNILIDASGSPFVADFGLALKDEDFGRGRGLAGTLAYMSPEQARGEGDTVDGRSDTFSLGIVFYELLTGRRPFRADSDAELLQRITATEPRPPRQIDDTIPEELEQICLKALSKRVSDRYTTALDIAKALKSFLPPAAPQAARSQGAQAMVNRDWVTLTRQQVESDALPPVCMACGAPATDYVNRTFSCTPEWVSPHSFATFLGAIVASLGTKEMRVACPVCPRHRNLWRKNLWVIGSGLLILPLLAGLYFLVAMTKDTRHPTSFVNVLGFVISVGLEGIGGLGLVAYLLCTPIRAIKITDQEITLQGVAAGFVRAAIAEEVTATKPHASGSEW
jgi:serine/threonine protein kinase